MSPASRTSTSAASTHRSATASLLLEGAAAEGIFGLVVVEVNIMAANFGVRECRGFWCKVYRHFVYRGYTSPQRPLLLPLL